MSVWSKPTDFFISSMTGYGISASTPFVEIGIGYNWLRMTLVSAKSQTILKGHGGSCSFGAGVLPASASLADESHVTMNNRIFTYSDKKITADDLIGKMDVYYTNVQFVSTKNRSGMLLYFLEDGFSGNLGWSVKAAAIVYAESQVTDFAQANLASARYMLDYA